MLKCIIQSCTSCLRPCARIMWKIISPTTLRFFESSASLETELLLSPEMMEPRGTCGSIDMTAPPNLVSLPLTKPKQTAPDNLNYFKWWEKSIIGWFSPDVINRVKWQKKKSSRDCYVLVSQPGEHMVNKNESRKNETKSTLISQSYS